MHIRLILTLVGFFLTMISETPFAQSTDNPLGAARIVWHMKTLEAGDKNAQSLQPTGPVGAGLKLEGDEYDQSLKRGGDGFAAVLSESWLSLSPSRANSLHREGDPVTLYIRSWIGPDGNGPLFFTDFLALAVDGNGLVIGSLGARTPQGKTFRVLLLGKVEKETWLDLVVCVSKDRLDFYCNGLLRSSIPLHQEVCSPFEDSLAIGARLWDGPDLHVHPVTTVHNARFDTVALWERLLSDKEIAFLSGVDKISRPAAQSPFDQAVQDYNDFFDASLNKDVATCDKLTNSIREFTDQDPFRPIYHLTPPVGAIFDPAGAYYYQGRYHVFSYHNILDLLHYCSLDHYVSEDLVHWTQWPLGPLADNPLDVYGIWLMNHFIDDQGIPSVLYTALGSGGKQGILARSHDGLVSYEDKKAILTQYVHDGHVWKEGDTWYAITTQMTKGTRPGNLGDRIMLWSSPDLEKWEEKGEIFTQPKLPESTASGDPAGFTEFPYLLSFGDKDVLMLGSHPVRYWVGKYDRERVQFVPDQPQGVLLDYANPFPCFNPSCIDQKGPDDTPRRIIMQLFPGVSGGVEGLSWSCAHALPRILDFDGARLTQEPVPEMQSLRGESIQLQDIRIKPDTSGYINKHGDTLEIIADFEPGDSHCFGLKLRVSEDKTSFVRIYYNTDKGQFGVDGKVPDTHKDLNLKPGEGAPSHIPKGQPVQMHVFLDKLLMEVFVNGQTCTTAAQDRNPDFNGVDLFSEGGTAQCLRLEMWEMKSANP